MSTFWIVLELSTTEVVSGDNWSYKSREAPVKWSPPTNQHPVCFTSRMPFLSPNQQCLSTEGKKYHIPWTCSSQAHLESSILTTKGSWLPWSRVAKPLISPLMPVPQQTVITSIKLLFKVQLQC